MIGSGNENNTTELTIIHNIFIITEGGVEAVFGFHLTGNITPLYLVKIDKEWINTPMECLYDDKFCNDTKRKLKDHQESLPTWGEAKRAGLATNFITESPEVGDIPLSKASYKPSAGILIHRELFAYIATQAHHQDDRYTIPAMSLLQALIRDKNKAQIKRFGGRMNELMVYLWVVAVNGTDNTTFEYGLPDEGKSARRFINDLGFEIVNFSTGVSKPAESRATLRQIRKRLPPPDSDDDKS